MKLSKVKPSDMQQLRVLHIVPAHVDDTARFCESIAHQASLKHNRQETQADHLQGMTL